MKRRFANSFEFDPSKPLVIPYGVYPHKASGMNQLVDHVSAVAIAQCVAKDQAEGAPGLPVYYGHPDVPELSYKYPDKAAHGWITACAPGETSCSLYVTWVDEPKAGAFIYFSPYFFGEDISKTETHINEMQSVGLLNKPNSTRFRLPNEAGEDSRGMPSGAPSNERTSMNKLLAILGLAATATEDEAAVKLQALVDENASLKTQVADLTRKCEECDATTASANAACGEAKKGMANEREARIGLLLDCALRDGKVTPATKPVWEGRLRRDFPNEAEALSKHCAEVKTRSALPNELGDGSPSGVLAKYEAMQEGPEKSAYLSAHAVQINDARQARK